MIKNSVCAFALTTKVHVRRDVMEPFVPDVDVMPKIMDMGMQEHPHQSGCSAHKPDIDRVLQKRC